MKRIIICFMVSVLCCCYGTNSRAEPALNDGANAQWSILAEYDSDTKRLQANDAGSLYIVGVSGSPIYTMVNSGYTTLINNVTLNNTTTSTTSSSIDIGERRKLGFLLSYNETEVGNSVSGTLTLESSPNGSIWIDHEIIIDKTGIHAPQGSLVYISDDEDVFYLPHDFTAGYIRATFTGTNTDADDTILISVWLCWQN